MDIRKRMKRKQKKGQINNALGSKSRTMTLLAVMLIAVMVAVPFTSLADTTPNSVATQSVASTVQATANAEDANTDSSEESEAEGTGSEEEATSAEETSTEAASTAPMKAKASKAATKAAGPVTSYAELTDAITAAPDGEETVIELANGFSLAQPVTIPSGKNIKLTADADASLQAPDGHFIINGTFTLTNNITLTGAVDNYSVAINESGTFNLTGGSITGNKCAGYDPTNHIEGCGVLLDGGTFNMSGGSISNNDASSPGDTSKGGAVRMEDGNFTMSGGTISNNKAGFGGGVVVLEGEFTFSGGSISNNTAADYGGGVQIGDFYSSSTSNLTPKFTMTNGTISDNTAVRGGGVYVALGKGDFDMTGGTITNNTSSSEGGGVTFLGDTFNMSGGATISSNKATNAGGGVQLAYGTFNMSGDSAISNNTSEVWGGGVYIEGTAGPATFNMSSGQINGNTSGTVAGSSGGGVYNIQGSFNLSGTGKIFSNTSYVGGGVSNVSGATCKITGGTIGGENADAANDAAMGGGIYNSGATSTVDMSGGTISLNKTTYYGGGICNVQGSFSLSGEGKIFSNTSGNTGGGVYNHLGSFKLSDDGKIFSNAANYGAGVANITGSTFNMSGGTIGGENADAANKAKSSGGGIFNGGVMSSSGTNSPSTVNMTGGTISFNESTATGGGVCNGDGSEFILDGGTISDNTAGTYGGGFVNRVMWRTGTTALLDIKDGEILDNTAGTYGGGIANMGSQKIEMTDGVISGNTALSETLGIGGGIYNAGIADIESGEITENTANVANYDTYGGGGGIYTSNYSNLTVGADAKFAGNSAALLTFLKTSDEAYATYVEKIKVPDGKWTVQGVQYGYNGFDINYKGTAALRVIYESGVTDATAVSNMPDSDVSEAGATYTVSDKVPTREGYDFMGWKTIDVDSGGAETLYFYGATEPNVTFTMPGKDVTLTAIWEVKETETAPTQNEPTEPSETESTERSETTESSEATTANDPSESTESSEATTANDPGEASTASGSHTQTGDNSHTVYLYILAGLALATLTALMFRRKKKAN